MERLKAPKTFTRGLALGPIFKLEKKVLKASKRPAKDLQAEQAAFEQAVTEVVQELDELAQKNPIFMGHVAIAQDPMLKGAVETKLEEGKNVEQAVEEASSDLRAMFRSLDDPYLREREDDVRDIGERLLAALQGTSLDPFKNLCEPSIVLAKNLLPSDTAKLPADLILGFMTEEGGVTSHVAIMSKSLGLPALVGVEGLMDAAKDKSFAAFDAATGELVLDPSDDLKNSFAARLERFKAEEETLRLAAKKPAVTVDGHTVKVFANLGSLKDLELALPHQPDGVGLFRSEFLFMDNNHWPEEEEQYAVYKAALEGLNGGELILRTLDIGGDKDLPYYSFPEEENPFLGWRAIRFCLDRTEIFKTQLRAALRASAHGPLRLMYPMIVALEELKAAKALLASCKAELKAEGHAFNEAIEEGIMVETPAAFIMAKELAEEADFFSIGTNDLTQYVLACDRGNKQLKELYDPLNPAVLRAIYGVIQKGHEAGIEVGMCGEFAGRTDVTELLLGMGLDEFSMAAPDMAHIKARVQTMNYEDAKAFALSILSLKTKDAVEAALKAR